MLVAKGYRLVDRAQPFLMPPDLRDWIPSGHPVHWVIESVEQLDTGELHRMRHTGGVGRRGYDPDMLLTVLIWAWSQGQRSSRQIERLCVEDVVYRFICAGNFPDHTAIARFRKDMGGLIEAYTEVARRLGVMGENERPTGPVLVQ